MGDRRRGSLEMGLLERLPYLFVGVGRDGVDVLSERSLEQLRVLCRPGRGKTSQYVDRSGKASRINKRGMMLILLLRI
jgi:hypothetical protein